MNRSDLKIRCESLNLNRNKLIRCVSLKLNKLELKDTQFEGNPPLLDKHKCPTKGGSSINQLDYINKKIKSLIFQTLDLSTSDYSAVAMISFLL